MDFHLNLQSESVDQAGIAESIDLKPTDTVRDAFRKLKEARTGAVLVREDDQLVGIFTERDALRLMASKADLDIPLREKMAKDPVSLQPNDTVGTAIQKMSQGGYRRLPIVGDGDKGRGVLKVSGILHYLVSHFPTVIYNLPPAPKHSTQQREGA